MENDPPKKKKKYVAVNRAKTNIDDQNGLNKNLTEGKELARSRFDYSFIEIVNHLLARLLPNPNYTVKLSQKLIFGNDKDLDDFIVKLDDNIKYTKGLAIELKDNKTKEDIDYRMQQHYRGKLFNNRLIEMSISNFFVGTKYQRDYDSFLAQFKDENIMRIYVRLSKEYADEFILAIKGDAVVMGEEDKPRRGNRTIFKKEIDSIQVESQYLNLNDMFKFFIKSQKLDRNELTVTKNRNQYDEIISYKISLMSYQEDKDRKIQGFSYYFRHQNFISLPLKDCKHKDSIIKQYGNINESHIQTQVIKGYKSSKWEDKSLLYKIRTGQFSKKKTTYTNQPFEAIHLKGLLPSVRQMIQQLEQQINEVPLDDIEEEIFVEFDQIIKDHIRNSKYVEIFIQSFIKDHMKQYDQICKVQKIKFPLRGVKLNIKIRNNSQGQFEHIKHNIQKVMPKYIAQQRISVDFALDDQFFKKLQEQSILMVENKQKQFVYLTSTDKLEECVKKVQRIIRQFQSIGQQSIQVVGLTKMSKYLDLIQNIKKDNEQYNQILIPEPTTQDKVHYKITFYGPRKKNDRFFEEIQLKIDKVQSQLGVYSEFIEEMAGKMIVEDDKIQQKVEKQWSISLVVGHITTSCRLQICSKKKSQILIIKSNSLDQIPLGSSIFFDNKSSLGDLKQKYLQKFKVNVKRFKQDKWLQQNEKSRNYRFLFRQNFYIRDMLKEAVSKQKQGQQTHLIGLIMPNKNKRQWLKRLFDILSCDGQLSILSFKIYIIESDFDEQIEKIVDIPEFSPFTADNEQILVEWFCQKRPYSKSTNTKINEAIANRQISLILDKEDIVSSSNTHICDLVNRTITCHSFRGNHNPIPFFFEQDSITMTFNGLMLRIPQSQYNKVIYHQRVSLQQRFYLNMPFYLIDLENNKQVNVFTNYQRPITKQQTKITLEDDFKGVIKAFYNQKRTQIIYNFKQLDAKNIQHTSSYMQGYIRDRWNKETIPIKEIKEAQFKDIMKERIQARAQQYSLKYDFNPQFTSITVEGFEQIAIDRFKQVMDNQVEYLINLSKRAQVQKISQIKYPQFWQPQKQQIQTFQVPKNSQQFIEIQKLYEIQPFHSLMRIQNKIIYRKYLDELQHLAHMNEKQPKQMKLFHGTGKTSPDIIWTDKEDGFNLNYSSDSNLLGRGIYFAEKAMYSLNYRSKVGVSNGQQIYGMLLCLVIVGDSQGMQMNRGNKQVRDTEFKPNGIRFQSMKGKHDICDVYVVYKNRRAYPLYLIRSTLT